MKIKIESYEYKGKIEFKCMWVYGEIIDVNGTDRLIYEMSCASRFKHEKCLEIYMM